MPRYPNFSLFSFVAPASRFALSKSVETVTVGTTVTFTATVLDQFGNTVIDGTVTSGWLAGAGALTGSLGEFTLTAGVASLSVSSTVAESVAPVVSHRTNTNIASASLSITFNAGEYILVCSAYVFYANSFARVVSV